MRNHNTVTPLVKPGLNGHQNGHLNGKHAASPSGLLATKAPPATPARSVRTRTGGQISVLTDLIQLKAALHLMRSGARVEGKGQKLGELLVSQALVTQSEVDRCLAGQKDPVAARQRLGELLVELGALDAATLRLVIAQQHGFPVVDLQRIEVDPAALQKLPPDACRRYQVLPLAVIDGRLVVAVGDANDHRAIEAARFASPVSVDVVVADVNAVKAAVARFFGAEDIDGAVAAATAEGEEPAASGVITLEQLTSGSEQQPVVRLVNHILLDAIRRGTSDVHLRPESNGVNVLFRIDGRLVPIRTISRGLMNPVVSRVKVIGRMDVATRLVPQDGNARVLDGDRAIDLRISVIPTVKGESVTIRILNADTPHETFDRIGFSAEDGERLSDALRRTSGMVLVTGPTGSGKSTTLYAGLRELVERGLTVMSVEDPVERQLDGVEQIPVNNAVGFTVERALRHILRHDPNAIMIGEIRDLETADIALESALTGHLVMSTLHTNSAAAALPRFLEMGVEPYVVASTVSMVVAQRLVRLNCNFCLHTEPVPARMREALGVSKGARFSHGVGCSHCGGTGHAGRQVIYELMPVTDEIRAAVLQRASSASLHAIAVEQGMKSIEQAALELAHNRRISLAEVYRIRLG